MEAATYGQLERAVLLFGEELVRAQVEMDRLQEVTSEHASLHDPAAQFGDVVERHEAVLIEQRERSAELSPADSYRALSRTYRAVVAQQRMIRAQYQAVLRNAQRMLVDEPVVHRRPYALIPPYYHRVSEAARPLTVNDLLSLVRMEATHVDAEGSDDG